MKTSKRLDKFITDQIKGEINRQITKEKYPYQPAWAIYAEKVLLDGVGFCFIRNFRKPRDWEFKRILNNCFHEEPSK